MPKDKIIQISFSNKTFDAVICLNADIPGIEVLNLLRGIPLYAADGAAEKLINLGRIPNFIIGDMDSFRVDKYRNYLPQERIIKISEQETNDFEKNLKFALKNNKKDVLVIGFHGGELEHTFNNWSVFSRYANALNLCIYDLGRYAFSMKKSFEMEVKSGEVISIIPQPKVKITTHNLKWKLDGEILEMGFREGARNIAASEIIQLEIHEGEILLFIDARLPFCPVYE